MNTSVISITNQEQIATISLNRPDKCNALNGVVVQQLRDALFAASRDSTIKAVLLKGEGKHFCAGADLDWMNKLVQSSFELNYDDARDLASLLYQMYSFPKPLVALAQGSTIGGGLGLLSCADIVIISEDARFSFSEVKLGLVPAVVSPYVVSVIGEHALRYYFLTAEGFNAQEAQRLGLAHKIVAAAELNDFGMNLTRKLLESSSSALNEVKRLLPLIVGKEISLELSEKTAEIFTRLRLSPDGKEGLRAFMEKRAPVWEDKA